MSLKNFMLIFIVINFIKSQATLKSINLSTVKEITLTQTISKLYIYIPLKTNQLGGFKYKIDAKPSINIAQNSFVIEIKNKEKKITFEGNNSVILFYIQIDDSLKITPLVYGFNLDKITYPKINLFLRPDDKNEYITTIYLKSTLEKPLFLTKTDKSKLYLNKIENIYYFLFSEKNNTYNILETNGNQIIIKNEISNESLKSNLVNLLSSNPDYKYENISSSGLNLNLLNFQNLNYSQRILVFDITKNNSTFNYSSNYLVENYLINKKSTPNNILLNANTVNGIYPINLSQLKNIRVFSKLSDNIFIENWSWDFSFSQSYSEKSFIVSIVFMILWSTFIILFFFYLRHIIKNKDSMIINNENKQNNLNTFNISNKEQNLEKNNKLEEKVKQEIIGNKYIEEKKEEKFKIYKESNIKESLGNEKPEKEKKLERSKSSSSSSSSYNDKEKKELEDKDYDNINLNIEKIDEKKINMKTINEVEEKSLKNLSKSFESDKSKKMEIEIESEGSDNEIEGKTNTNNQIYKSLEDNENFEELKEEEENFEELNEKIENVSEKSEKIEENKSKDNDNK